MNIGVSLCRVHGFYRDHLGGHVYPLDGGGARQRVTLDAVQTVLELMTILPYSEWHA
jgi:hypothetical protein